MRQKTSPKKMTVHQKSNDWLFLGGLVCEMERNSFPSDNDYFSISGEEVDWSSTYWFILRPMLLYKIFIDFMTLNVAIQIFL